MTRDLKELLAALFLVVVFGVWFWHAQAFFQ